MESPVVDPTDSAVVSNSCRTGQKGSGRHKLVVVLWLLLPWKFPMQRVGLRVALPVVQLQAALLLAPALD
jgi:hypothetical protein